MSLYLESTVPSALASSMSLGIFILSLSSLEKKCYDHEMWLFSKTWNHNLWFKKNVKVSDWTHFWQLHPSIPSFLPSLFACKFPPTIPPIKCRKKKKSFNIINFLLDPQMIDDITLVLVFLYCLPVHFTLANDLWA